jgi:hypothetical protein
MFLTLCRRHRLPQPEVNVKVERFEVDFLWPARVVSSLRSMVGSHTAAAPRSRRIAGAMRD